MLLLGRDRHRLLRSGKTPWFCGVRPSSIPRTPALSIRSVSLYTAPLSPSTLCSTTCREPNNNHSDSLSHHSQLVLVPSIQGRLSPPPSAACPSPSVCLLFRCLPTFYCGGRSFLLPNPPCCMSRMVDNNRLLSMIVDATSKQPPYTVHRYSVYRAGGNNRWCPISSACPLQAAAPTRQHLPPMPKPSKQAFSYLLIFKVIIIHK